ncbi:hypothetical protein Q8W71_26050 [Methylobacterium sp. NEAU 140]|uniref:hypothetical protein n=1 Tax=Methylobacterium sp. NEAU 140 TaxID=3064945 RepID=UPI002733E181|nr:hypothetical protein [Methylobacterium sp. NEAU 140]MDP4026096.1 hypothetical protein [Methylobacterium sp. NEAU 140]
MEHFRSTLATTAAAVFGLVTAAHVLHPGNFEAQTRRTGPIAARTETAPVTVWVDPPSVLRLRTRPMSPDTAALTPHMTVPLPPGMTMAPIVPAEMTVVARSQPTGAVHQRKVARRGIRVQQAVLIPEQFPAAATGPRPAARSGDGPLDDLLRGLGLAGDGEG